MKLEVKYKSLQTNFVVLPKRCIAVIRLKWKNQKTVVYPTLTLTSPPGIIQIDPCFAKCIGLPEHTYVTYEEIPAGRSSSRRHSVTIEPCDTNDFEVMEHNLQLVEETLLLQCRVVNRNVKFPIWIDNSPVFCRVKLTPDAPDHVILQEGDVMLATDKMRRKQPTKLNQQKLQEQVAKPVTTMTACRNEPMKTPQTSLTSWSGEAFPPESSIRLRQAIRLRLKYPWQFGAIMVVCHSEALRPIMEKEYDVSWVDCAILGRFSSLQSIRRSIPLGKILVLHGIGKLTGVPGLRKEFVDDVISQLVNTCEVVIGTTQKKSDALSFLKSGFFSKVIEAQEFKQMDRFEYLQDRFATKGVYNNERIRELAQRTKGFTSKDLDMICELCIQADDSDPIADLLKGYLPEVQKEVRAKQKAQKPNWDKVGGLEKIKTLISDTLMLPIKYSRIFSKSPLKTRGGILVYGPPGCGKTLVCQGAAAECGMNLITVKGPELLNKYVGASEAAVREVFNRAFVAQPCVLYFDEFDALAPTRGGSGAQDRVVNQLLTFLDGVSDRGQVGVLAGSSRPDMIDPALRRPGRLDKSVYLGFPTQLDRKDIFHKLLGDLVPLEGREKHLEQLADKSVDFSGADIASVVTNAQLLAVQEALDTNSQVVAVVPWALLYKVLEETQPRLPKRDREFFDRVYAEFQNKATAKTIEPQKQILM